MKKVIGFFVLFLVLLSGISLASPTPLEYYESVVELGSDHADYTFTFLFKTAPEGTLEYPLSYDIEKFETSANFRNYTCNAQDKKWGTLIFCDFTQAGEGGRALSIRFRRSNSVEKIENIYHFEGDIETPQKVPRMVTKAVLDKEFILISEPEKATTLVPFTPKNTTKGSDGRHIFLVWERKNLEKGEGLDFSVSYERTSPMPQDNTIFLIPGVIVLIILLILGLKFKKEGPNEIESMLKEDERKAIEIVKSHGGMCKQREIVRESNFSKAKVSRLVKDLKERKLIKVEKAGRTNKIYLENMASST